LALLLVMLLLLLKEWLLDLVGVDVSVVVVAMAAIVLGKWFLPVKRHGCECALSVFFSNFRKKRCPCLWQNPFDGHQRCV